MSQATVIYMSGFLILQVLAILSTLEFTRKPWLGKKLEIEKAVEFQNDKLLESISSYHNDFTGRSLDPKALEQERLMLLKTAYEDPFNAFFNVKDEQDEEVGMKDIYSAPDTLGDYAPTTPASATTNERQVTTTETQGSVQEN